MLYKPKLYYKIYLLNIDSITFTLDGAQLVQPTKKLILGINKNYYINCSKTLSVYLYIF